jgi:hypothetical protein
VVALAGSVAVRLLANRTRLIPDLSAALSCCSFTPRYDRGRALVDVPTVLSGGGEARVLRGCGQMSSEPRGPAVRLVFGTEPLPKDPLLASGADNLDRDQNGPDD